MVKQKEVLNFVEEEIDLSTVFPDKPAEEPQAQSLSSASDVDITDWLETYKEYASKDPNAPTEEQLHLLKEKYGSVYFLPISRDKFYLYRPILGKEYEEIIELLIKNSDPESSPRTQERMLNKLVAFKCVIYPKITPANEATLPAGTLPSLSHVIHLVSNFADPNLLNQMVFEL